VARYAELVKNASEVSLSCTLRDPHNSGLPVRTKPPESPRLGGDIRSQASD
jgi:hypothetical protein